MPVDVLEVIEPGDRLVERGAGLHLLDMAFHLGDAPSDHAAVDGLDSLRHVGEHGEAGGGDLGEAAEHDNLLRAVRAVHGEDARPQRGDRRRVTGQHAEIAFGAGHVHLLDLAREQELFRRDQIEMEIGHYLLKPCSCRSRNPLPCRSHRRST